MPILSNTPTIRYITIQNLVIKDSNVYYPIVTTETSRKYIYWDKDSPYELICEDEMLEDRANLYLLVINKKGNFTIVNQDSISVNFDENIKLDGFNSKLNATVEKVDEHTKKFMSVTEDINGINKTVGTITEDLNETNEKLTNYKQTADQIAIDLQNTNKKYNDDKEFNKLRENIISLLISENTLLIDLNSTIKDITRDNNFTAEEKNEVKETQSKITNKNDLLIIEVDKLISTLEKEGLTDKKNQLTSVKEEYGNAFSLLNSTLNSLVSGSVITPTQITTLINCISNVSTKLTKLKNICDEIIFLGTGGTLYEEITKITMTAGGIHTKISSIEENIKSNLSLEKGILNQHVKDLQTTVDKIETIIKEIYIDGLVNQNEKDLVSQNLEIMKNEHNDLINKYNEYLSNKHLSQEMKVKLQKIYSDYVSGYNAFVNELKTVISDGFFNESEKTNVDLKLEYYRKNIVIFHNNLSLAIDDYEENRYKSEIETHKNQLQGEINKVQQDLSNLTENVEGTFKDNIIDESERNSIKQNIKNLDIQKANIDSQYNQLYKNPLLVDPLKSQFTKVYTDFNGSYDTLLSTLNEILNKDTLITQQDKINMDKCYADLVLKTTEYTTVVNQVVEFIANAEAEQSKASFQDEIDDLQKQIDGLDLNIDGAFADGILSEVEKISLKNNLDMLKIEKVDVDNQYKQTYNNSNLSSSNKSNLKKAYDNYITAYNALVKFIETLIASADNVNDTHKVQLDTLLKDHNDKLALYVVQYNIAIENISKSYTDATKNALQQQIEGVSDSVLDLEKDMNGVFQDSVLTEAEKIAIKERLQSLQIEKVNIDNQYNTLNNNADLVDKDSLNTPKTNLKTAYINLVTSYNKLVDAINTLLYTEGVLDESHRKPVNDSFADYKAKLGIYSTRVNEAIDAISKKRVEDESGYRNEQYSELNQTMHEISTKVGEVKQTADGALIKATSVEQTADGLLVTVSKKVGKDEIISSINQTAEAVKINANKINLNGYVTMTNLSTPGQTIIDGGNIKTGTIESIKLRAIDIRGKSMIYIEDDGILSCDGNAYLKNLFIPETHPGWRPGTIGTFSCAPNAYFNRDIHVTNEIYTQGKGVIQREEGVYIKIRNMGIQNTGEKIWLLVNGYQSNHSFGVDLWYSDASLKENIVNIDQNVNLLKDNQKIGLDLINSINHFSYNYKEDAGVGCESVDCGYIAQQLKEVNPSLVREVPQQDGNILLEPRASMIIPHLSKAIQEQDEKIKNLEEKIAKLEALL